MTAVPFDTLKLARALRDKAKLTPEQAEGVADALAEAFRDDIASKADIAELRRDVELAKHELTIRVGAMIVALGGFLAAIRFFAP